jgi:exosortase D (VPLPA-CTERM-specific)
MAIQSIEIPHTNPFRIGFIGLVGILIALVAFNGALLQLVDRWSSQEEYSHGFLVPVLVVWLFWMRRDALRASVGRPVWGGPIALLLATVMHITGEMSATPILSQAGFVLAIVGLVLGLGGYGLLRTAMFPILFLLFAIPLPRFIDSAMSLHLQLVSSELGAFFIKLFGIPVYLDGNVIDLGYYKVQIVEACSGLRYIYPLLSLSFLAAYMFKAPLWQRTLVFLSAIPITILMNSVRIGLVGLAVSYWGTQAADGLFHFFEGWIIFLGCGGILALEIYVLARVFGKSFFEVFSFPKATLGPVSGRGVNPENQAPLVVSLLLLCLTGLAVFHISGRAEVIPDRPRFVSFPERIGSWKGHAILLDPQMERVVGADDYLLSDYKGSNGEIINFYVAYYASQRKNDRPHSPSDCIPANGWKITKFVRTIYSDIGANWPLNRVVIERNSTKQLVYYWFDERGRKIANEYLAKWYLRADAVVMNRTDGALVRLVTQIDRGETEHDADLRLQAFIRDALPTLSEFLPAEVTSQTKITRFLGLKALNFSVVGQWRS